MLIRVVNPNKGIINFGYDPLGRRIYKEVKTVKTNWLWDGNVPLHEWKTTKEEPLIDIITWVFEDGGFVPVARITDKGSQSIVTDYLGTPTQMYDADGEKTWSAQLDIYGRVRIFAGSSLSECPFRYQGQYQDEETGLYYNRFRYYDPVVGNYISSDPIGLEGGNPSLYGCVNDSNKQVDLYGLDVYVLVTTKAGWYPVYEYGKLDPTSYTKLSKGEIYKIGETQRPKTRYSHKAKINKSNATSIAFDANGNKIPAGLKKKTVSKGGTKAGDRELENRLLKQYKNKHGKLPAGNKHLH